MNVYDHLASCKLASGIRLATSVLATHTALPVASLTATSGTATGLSPVGGGKVTPVRYEHGHQDGSGQEENAEHICSRF